MTASPLDHLPEDLVGWVGEAKWDGFRAGVARPFDDPVQLVSRRGTALARAFPEIVTAAERDLPPGTVADGELVIWSGEGLSFDRLQQRLRSRRGIQRQAAEAPAHMVLFDLLYSPLEGNLMPRPYRERRAALERLFAEQRLGPPWTLCPASSERKQMQEWLSTPYGAVGIDGVVLKHAASPYTPGRRGGWRKVRARDTTEAIVGAVSPSREAVRSVLLGRLDAQGRLRYVGRTAPLPATAAALVADAVTAAGPGHPWAGRRFSAGWSSGQSLAVEPVRPDLVAEIQADTAIDQGKYRHLTRWVRLRADMTPADLPLFGEGNRPAAG
ncbi:ATP-dependent DNA ligase [Streptomyces sp. NPDC021100]|uniref:ATP-dependent DNA ligase n=1 Tax=Streptomyces sp. NPDC021100 TaxID=3365114 RepID=UPI00379BD1FB